MDKNQYLLAAIEDTQATIRAVDVKVAALLIGVLAPLQSFNRVFAHLIAFVKQSMGWPCLLIAVAFVILWLLALAALVRAIAAIDNPARHVVNSGSAKGTFYGGGLYGLKLIDVFTNRTGVKARKDTQTFLAELPSFSDEITEELTYEHMKVIYIREVKLKRLQWGIHFSLAWLALGVFIFVSSKFGLL